MSQRVFRVTLFFLLISCSCLGMAQLRTGIYRGRVVTYKLVNGRKIFEGDIVLDHVEDITAGGSGFGVGVGYGASLWPKVGSVFQVPYTITSGGQQVTDSIAAFNATFPGLIQWVPHTSETDYVDFDLDPNDHSQVCFSSEGRVGGKQTIGG